jgi:hypothetical protein
MHYTSDIWRLFGLNIHDTWELDAAVFFEMCRAVDQARAEEKKKPNG